MRAFCTNALVCNIHFCLQVVPRVRYAHCRLVGGVWVVALHGFKHLRLCRLDVGGGHDERPPRDGQVGHEQHHDKVDPHHETILLEKLELLENGQYNVFLSVSNSVIARTE
jgi:hypothetical protein